MDELGHDRAQRLLEEHHELYRRQRRFLIEIGIAVGFICLLGGFLAGASWQYTRQDAKHIIIEVPVESEPERRKTRAWLEDRFRLRLCENALRDIISLPQ